MAGCWANTYNSGLVAYPRAIIAFDGGFTDAETSLFYSTASIDMIKFHAMNREQFVAYGHDQLSSKTYLILKQNGQPIAKYEITPYIAQEKGMQSLRLMPDNTIYFTSNNKLFKVSMPFSVSVLSQNISQILAINNRLIYALYNSKIYKSVNGGQSWTEEFSVAAEYEYPVGVLEKNGYVWAIFKNTASAQHIIAKYKP